MFVYWTFSVVSASTSKLITNLFSDFYKGFKLYVENYPEDKRGSKDRNFIPDEEHRFLCFQHDAVEVYRPHLSLTCGRSLLGNSTRVELRDRYTQLVLCDIKVTIGALSCFNIC